MPEEHNRVLIDHLADLCCAPTQLNHANLRAEAIPAHRVLLTGNTIVEAVQAMLPGPTSRTRLLAKHKLTARSFVLATLHRPENVDHPETLDLLLTQLATIGAPVILLLHPRTARRIDEFRLAHCLASLPTTEPLDYPNFLALAHSAAMLISDSGVRCGGSQHREDTHHHRAPQHRTARDRTARDRTHLRPADHPVS